jgi:riboflavin-specific deaminase-like protein
MPDHKLDAPGMAMLAADEADWKALLERFRSGATAADDTPTDRLYWPLCLAHRRRGPHDSFAIGHLAQSLDGRIATNGGVSRWLSGVADLLHTHRMRALSDAVLVGVNTVFHDNPRLTVRRCAGRHPVRVVIDPERRLDGSQHVFTDDAAPTMLLTAADRTRGGEALGCAEIVAVPRDGNCLDPHEIRRLLARRGLNWLFVEGGGITVSRFLAARALDRLQITVAPVLLGSGRPSIILPEITDLRDSLRPRTRRFVLDEDVMIECDFNDE